MDFEAIDKIADRIERLIEDDDQEKVFRENKEIIKLQVAQYTALWEQTKKLADVMGEHVHFLQKKLQLQMQHEELSSEYQELRRRSEILVNYTRKLCDELDKSVPQLMELSAGDKADRETVCGLRQLHEPMMQQAETRINELQEKLKGMTEQRDQLREKYKVSELHVQALGCMLEAAGHDCNRLAAATKVAKKKLEAAKIELKMLQLPNSHRASAKRAGESPTTPTTTNAPKRARADAPGTSVAGEGARRHCDHYPPAADEFTAGSSDDPNNDY